MKKILFISPFRPNPEGTGSERRAFQHITALSKIADLDVCVLIKSDKGNSLRPKTLRARITLIATLFRALIIKERIFIEHGYSAQIASLSDRISKSDIIYFFKIISAAPLFDEEAFKNLYKKQIWVDFDDVESVALGRAKMYSQDKNGPLRNIWIIQRIRLFRRAEHILLDLADAVFVCSETDRRRFLQSKNASKVLVIPNTISIAKPEFTVTDELGEDSTKNILFVGTMNYDPNIDAMEYFVAEILPRIKRYVRNVRLTIVGYDPTKEVKKLADIDGIEVTGSVDNLEPYYKKASVVIAPIRFGGGTRIKILEAYQYGRAVVSTSIGCEGLDLIPDKEILIGDTPDDFAAGCLQLINDLQLRTNIARHGWEKVSEKYSINVPISTYSRLLSNESAG